MSNIKLTTSTFPKRLNKFISDSGYCSRRSADKLIEDGRVTINDVVPELGTKVLEGDIVKVDGFDVAPIKGDKSDRVYIAYNKPIGITCTTESHVRGNIIDAIGHKKRIFPIGRLDKDSEGLILLTSDGDIVNKILRAENGHDKEYIVTVDKPISERFVDRMARGVPIIGTITNPCIVKPVSRFVFTIILNQGLNRQIRRMCEYLDYEVVKLKRSRIMKIELDNLAPGQWRDLTESEMAEINSAVKSSSKTAVNTAQPKNVRNINAGTNHASVKLKSASKEHKPRIYQYTPPAKDSAEHGSDVEKPKNDNWPYNSVKPKK
ncbi:23S rRNA pseudouridine(2604) synthase RluF [Colwellia echini]|uniref:Pseudouridine synthase n=1 Tax=Colwellia echini TaxID=1982103 RepID=A0ABY3MSS6_9GAMM|nr:23S rRNA pseudouridine(2604) synthase RluF [Colwellia echini]TYK64253.1 23S rRNA pseudouridine(2604) synthase RluF [Colwellia echini]